MPTVRKLTFATRFALKDRTLRMANRRVDKFKNRVQQGGTMLDRMRNKAAMAGSAITTAFKDAKRAVGRGVKVLERYRHQLAIGAGAMTAAIGKMTKDAGDANEIMNKFNVVFGEAAEQTRKWAKQYSDAIGRSEYATQDWLNSFQDVLVPMGLARKEAAQLSKRMVKLSADLGSFNNVATSEAAKAMQSALVGNHEAVRKLGIQLSETQLDMVAQREGYQKSFRELDNLTKMQLRFQEMLRQSGDAIDDATRTSMQFNNQWLRFQGNLRDVSVGMGQVFLPILRNALIGVNNFMEALQENERLQIAARFFGIATAITAIAAAIGMVSAAWPVIAGLFSWPFAAIAAGIVGIAMAFEDIWVSLQGGEGRIVPMINQFLDWIGISWDFIDAVDAIGTALNMLWTGTKATVKMFLPLFKSVFKGIIDILYGTTKMVVGTFQMITGLIKGLLTGDFQQFETGLRNFYEGFGQAFGGIINIVGSAVKFIYDALAGVFNWFSNIEWEWPSLSIGDWWQNVKEGFAKIDFAGAVKSQFDEMMDSLPGWMKGMAKKVMDFLPQSPAKEGPMKKLDKVGPGLTNTVAEGINKNQDQVDKALVDMWSGNGRDPKPNKTVRNSTVNRSRTSKKSERSLDVTIQNLNINGDPTDDAAMKAKMERMAREVFGKVIEEEDAAVAGEA